MLAALDGSCRTPIAGFAEADGGRLTIEGLLLRPDGSEEIRGRLDATHLVHADAFLRAQYVHTLSAAPHASW